MGGATIASIVLPLLQSCEPTTAPFAPTNGMTSPSSTTVSVADLNDAMPAKFVHGIVGPDNLPVLVTRISATDFRAFSSRCTHTGCAIQSTVQDSGLPCLCHGSRFGLDGSVLQGPATAPLAAYASHYDATAQTLTITLNA